ncbi:MAG: flagellar biosynthetic protein FliR [Candidatus Binataceae bacterium]
MNLTIGNDLALAFSLLFARAGSVMMALPSLLGVALPVRIRLLLAGVMALGLMPLASVAQPGASGVLPITILVVRELGVGVALSFAAAIVVGAVMTAGSVIGGSMDLNTGAILRADIESPNVLGDAFGVLAGLLFFVGGFHRMLLVALANSLTVAPLGTLSLPEPALLLRVGGRMFALGLALSLPLLVPLFVLSLAKGVIARLAPQVNILIAAPAAVVTAGLVLLALDVSGLSAGIMRAWTSVMSQSLEWFNG